MEYTPSSYWKVKGFKCQFSPSHGILGHTIDKRFCYRRDNMPAGDRLAVKTNLAVSSIEFCQAIFDERDIREALGGCCGHIVIIPLL
jgi:hypothetical protein